MREWRADRSGWWVAAGLVGLSLVPALAGTARVIELVQGAAVTPANARFIAMPAPVVLHIVAAIPFSILGALQFVPALRQTQYRWHREVGRLLVVLGLLVAITGLWMAQYYPWPPNDGMAVYLERLVFGSGMIASLALAVGALRRRDYAAHGRWMTRGYAIGLGAGTQVFTHLPYLLLVGEPGTVGRGVMMGAGWVVNLVVAEWCIRGRPSYMRSADSRREARGDVRIGAHDASPFAQS